MTGASLTAAKFRPATPEGWQTLDLLLLAHSFYMYSLAALLASPARRRRSFTRSLARSILNASDQPWFWLADQDRSGNLAAELKASRCNWSGRMAKHVMMLTVIIVIIIMATEVGLHRQFVCVSVSSLSLSFSLSLATGFVLIGKRMPALVLVLLPLWMQVLASSFETQMRMRTRTRTRIRIRMLARTRTRTRA